jgi:hypothetical protein
MASLDLSGAAPPVASNAPGRFPRLSPDGARAVTLTDDGSSMWVWSIDGRSRPGVWSGCWRLTGAPLGGHVTGRSSITCRQDNYGPGAFHTDEKQQAIPQLGTPWLVLSIELTPRSSR